MYKKFFKRLFDILVSLVAIALIILPLGIICIVVKCESKGPAIFKSQRIGKDGKIFDLYKVRSMTTCAPDNVATRHINGQKYITKTGRFLRKSSLDELPQFFNILKGDMSLIGPRPSCLCEEDLHRLRFKNGSYTVRPGLTGLAQINGRDVLALDYTKKAALDAEYAKNVTFWQDFKIFFKTFPVVFHAENVVEGCGAETEERVEISEQEVKERFSSPIISSEQSPKSDAAFIKEGEEGETDR